MSIHAEKKLDASSNGKIDAYGAMLNAAIIPNYSQFRKEIEKIEQNRGYRLSNTEYEKTENAFLKNLKKLNASQEISRSKYDGRYPPTIEFEKPWECYKSVRQSGAKTSDDGTPLESGGFSKCIAMLMKNEKNGQTALYHIMDIDLEADHCEELTKFMSNYVLDATLGEKKDKKVRIFEMLNSVCKYRYPDAMTMEKFQSMMEGFNREGKLRAKFIYGKIGRQSTACRVGNSILTNLGVKMDSDIYVDSGRWSVVYKPTESMIYIDSSNQKELILYQY